MKKNIILIVFALLLLGGCKKDKDVHVAKVQAETPDVTTTANTADISGTYSYASTLKSVVIVYGKDASLSSPQKATAEHTRDSYSVTINNLDPGTTYYYYCIFDTGYGATESEYESFATQNVSALTVTTSSVSNITQTTATCGGNVTSNGGATVTARGVCWSTSPNPTVSNSHTTNGSGTGSFTSHITGLTANTKYYVRAYATNSAGTSYGQQKSFTTLSSGGGDHEYVDLGLPSGLLWATCNVGANSPEDYGDYYAWGETETKSIYDISTYKWCNGSETSFTKYNTDSNCGIVDNKTVLDPEDDAAHVNWGGAWRMPTREETKELHDRCTWTWTTQNGVKGSKVTGPNGKSIFLPAAGYYNGDSLYNASYYNGDTLYYESLGTYWSSLLSTDDPRCAYHWYFSYENVNTNLYCGRAYGLSVRPVYGSQSVYTPTVTTFIVSDITQTTATCGGNVTSDGGAAVTARGVCWSMSQNPTVSNSHTTNGSGTGSFTSNITGLTKNTTYYVRAYATNGKGTSYGEQKSFTTQSGGGQTQTFTVNGVSFEMISVEGGTFTMGATSEQGSDVDSDEKPTHSVTLSDYYIGKFEVTQELWEAVMGSNPSYFNGSNLPVEDVSWNDCQEFITKLNGLTGKNFRLPTEAEWEYAARGGNRSGGYKYSGSNELDEVAWYITNSGGKTHTVGTKSPNELGIYDMSGNVWEWCQDWYGSYSSGSQTNPQGPSSGSNRVDRGGSWHYGPRDCRVSNRDYYAPSYRRHNLGFRVVLIP